MTDAPADPALVARCGLYCGACRAYRSGKCPGCGANAKAGWCQVRACCIAKDIATCAQCDEHADPRRCGKYDNFMAWLFGFVFRSDRAACVDQIRRLGLAGHAAEMSRLGRPSLKR